MSIAFDHDAIPSGLLAIPGGAGIAAALAAKAEQAARVCGHQGGFGHGVAWAPAETPAI